MRKLATVSVVLLFFVAGCATTGGGFEMPELHKVTYDIGLEEVRRPTDIRERYGEYEITKADTSLGEGNTVATKYVYQDSLISIGWIAVPRLIAFELENNSDQTMKIVWDEGAFIDPDGGSQRIMHSGVNYIDREKPQSPTIVPAGSNVSDVVQPTDYVSYSEYTGWEKDAILQPYTSYELSALQPAKQNEGKFFSVLLPLEVEGVTNEYTFRFKVQDVQIPKPQPDTSQAAAGQPTN